jgi:hypothetical protein
MDNEFNSGALAGNLGESDYGMGEVDMFGLDEFGNPAGADSMWGAVIGGGVSTGAAILARSLAKDPTAKLHKYSELTGLLAGAVAGGIMMAFPGTRRMGWAAAATALVTSGLRQLEQSLMSKSAGMAGVTIDPTGVIQPGGGFGIHTIEPGYSVPSAGFGAATIDPAYPVPGSISGGSAGFGADRPELVGPPTLVGAGDYGMNDNPGVQQTKLLGGPNVSAIGAHFGATLFGSHN